ncbi:MAG: Lrp/AsnC family transcriptional regulator [Neomegalonema sp.]|nr:Lrp/AsnC family transcriptional regulator [Neomegalonema sp.]
MAELDPINQKILHELERDARISNTELAGRVGLSPSACLRRVQELERSGIIRGYRAVLNRAAIGGGFTAYIGVGLALHTKKAQSDFVRAITASPAVVACHNITGPIEYLLRVETPDITAYKHFHTNILGAAPHVAAITTYVVLASEKDELG